jgi:hypothetical protein
VGATALTYPFLRGVPSFAGGADTSGKMYLVLLYTSCGVVRPMWGAYGPPATGSTAVVTPLSSTAPDGGVGGFRPTLSAFKNAGGAADLTDQINVLDGLNNAAANCGSHEPGMASLWTGQTLASDGQHAQGWSIDQAISTALVASGVKTSVPNIPLYAVSNCDEQTRGVHNRMLYGPANAGISDYVDPISVPSGTSTSAMNVLFPSVMADAGANPSPAIRAAVQNQVNTELTALAGRLCSDDRYQLLQLQTYWNNADTQLSMSAAAAAACSQPVLTAQPAGDPFGNACGVMDPLPYNITAMSNILAMALACDLTRVASLQMSQALSPAIHTWLPSYGAALQTHHQWSHAGSASSLGAIIPGCQAPPTDCGPDPLYTVTPAELATGGEYGTMYAQQLIDIDAWYAKQIAAFAYMLSQLPNTNGTSGQSLLDQTIICCGSELDMGAAHNHDDTPFLLIGGKGSGKVRTGQLVRFPLNLQAGYYSAVNRPPTSNRFHNDLLVTLAQIMGVGAAIPTFGASTMAGSTFGATGNLTLNQGPILEILPAT